MVMVTPATLFLSESLMQGPKVSHKGNDQLIPNAKTGLIDL